MHESFLHYIWQFQYFSKSELITSADEGLEILHPGFLNTNAGPDFSQGRVKIEGIEWVGSVELHTKASGYLDHLHHRDPAYDNVVLHVVWENDKPVTRSDGTPMPTLQLKGRVDESLLRDYRKLVNSAFQIPCSKSFRAVDDLTKISMLEKAAIQRLDHKATLVLELAEKNNGDWEETFYQALGRNFGFKVNSEPFLRLTKGTPYKVIRKHASQLNQVEAIMFGQAGFLDLKKGDPYYLALREEYGFLQHKYQLADRKMLRANWKFLRLRPANFPTLRIAQFCALISASKPLFSMIKEADDIKSLKKLFAFEPSPYWHGHYQFGKITNRLVGSIGEATIENLIINSVVPVLAAYAKHKGESSYFDRAISLLQQLPAESNAITKSWQKLGMKVAHAFDSQGLIEQMNSFCKKRNCLNCTVGAAILKPIPR